MDNPTQQPSHVSFSPNYQPPHTLHETRTSDSYPNFSEKAEHFLGRSVTMLRDIKSNFDSYNFREDEGKNILKNLMQRAAYILQTPAPQVKFEVKTEEQQISMKGSIPTDFIGEMISNFLTMQLRSQRPNEQKQPPMPFSPLAHIPMPPQQQCPGMTSASAPPPSQQRHPTNNFPRPPAPHIPRDTTPAPPSYDTGCEQSGPSAPDTLAGTLFEASNFRAAPELGFIRDMLAMGLSQRRPETEPGETTTISQVATNARPDPESPPELSDTLA